MGTHDEARAATQRDFGLLRQFGENLRDFLALLFRPPRPIQFRSAGLAPVRVLVVAAGSLGAIAVAILLLDVPATTAVRHLPLWLISIFDSLSDLGKSGWLLFPIGLFLLGLAALTGRNLSGLSRLVVVSFALRLTFVFAAIALPGIFVTIVKRLIGRARPFVELDGGSFVLVPFGWSADYASIPSGHGTTAFAAAVAIGAVWPRTRSVMWLYAILIAASRVVVTAHYPSDLLASAFFGILGALLVRHSFAIRRLGFVVDRSGAVHPLPGPSLRRLKSVAQRLPAQ
jgi:undecaprenyl-diphosphatase